MNRNKNMDFDPTFFVGLVLAFLGHCAFYFLYEFIEKMPFGSPYVIVFIFLLIAAVVSLYGLMVVCTELIIGMSLMNPIKR